MFAGGRLDPQGIYGTLARVQDRDVTTVAHSFVLCFFPPLGSEKREVELKNRLPPNIIPNTAVVRELTITGETGTLTYRASAGSACENNQCVPNGIPPHQGFHNLFSLRPKREI